eukprot:c14327_g1_i1 orf=1-282(-)
MELCSSEADTDTRPKPYPIESPLLHTSESITNFCATYISLVDIGQLIQNALGSLSSTIGIARNFGLLTPSESVQQLTFLFTPYLPLNMAAILSS